MIFSHFEELEATEALSPDAALPEGRVPAIFACLLSGFDSGAADARDVSLARFCACFALSLISNSLAISLAAVLLSASSQSLCLMLDLNDAGEDVRLDALSPFM